MASQEAPSVRAGSVTLPTSPDELEALPPDTMVRDHMGDLHVRHETFDGLRLWQEVGMAESLTSDELVAQVGGTFRTVYTPQGAPQQAPVDELLLRSIRTLLPGLEFANYTRRWVENSPAIRALNVLEEAVGHDPTPAGALMGPHVSTAHACRPEGSAPAHLDGA